MNSVQKIAAHLVESELMTAEEEAGQSRLEMRAVLSIRAALLALAKAEQTAYQLDQLTGQKEESPWRGIFRSLNDLMPDVKDIRDGVETAKAHA